MDRKHDSAGSGLAEVHSLGTFRIFGLEAHNFRPAFQRQPKRVGRKPCLG